MALIKEDGSIVPNANTYATDDDLTAYAAARAITLPATPELREPLLIKAMDYLETLDAQFMGSRKMGYDQPLLWPRTGVYLYGALFAHTQIPPELVKAQIVIAIASQSIEIFPNAPGVARLATRKTVGPITVEYSEQGAAESLNPVISQADALLDILFGTASGQMWVTRA